MTGDCIITFRSGKGQDKQRELCSQPGCPGVVFQVVEGPSLLSHSPLQLLQADGTLKPREAHASAVGRIHV